MVGGPAAGFVDQGGVAVETVGGDEAADVALGEAELLGGLGLGEGLGHLVLGEQGDDFQPVAFELAHE